MTQRIIIAEDEERMSTFMEDGLSRAGFSCDVVADGLAAFQLASEGNHDLMILDVGLPLIDGFGVLTLLRQAGNTLPVVILTARTSLQDTVTGLESGADDYITKPFAFAELLARVHLRMGARKTTDTEEQLEHGGIRLEPRARQATVDGRAIDLSSREYTLLELFMRNPGQVLTREQILDRVWANDIDPDSNIVSVYVQYLRRKIGDGAIETVRGLGYRLAMHRSAVDARPRHAGDDARPRRTGDPGPKQQVS